MCLYNVSARWTVKTDKFTMFVYCNFLVLLSTPLCSQNINKQNVNIADKTLKDYSFLSRYHYAKSKNYFKRRYRIRRIPMFIGTPCISKYTVMWQNIYFNLILFYLNNSSGGLLNASCGILPLLTIVSSKPW